MLKYLDEGRLQAEFQILRFIFIGSAALWNVCIYSELVHTLKLPYDCHIQIFILQPRLVPPPTHLKKLDRPP